MTASRLRAVVIAARLEWLERMLVGIRSLPLDSVDAFTADARNVASAESYLRRALEALLDFGRHVLAKGFGEPAAEYKTIAALLVKHEVLSREDGETFRLLAGYRNRMVHFYHELSEQELYEICAGELGDIERVRDGMLQWIRSNPDRIDRAL